MNIGPEGQPDISRGRKPPDQRDNATRPGRGGRDWSFVEDAKEISSAPAGARPIAVVNRGLSSPANIGLALRATDDCADSVALYGLAPGVTDAGGGCATLFGLALRVINAGFMLK
jgi:hypothetical protein